MIPLTKDVIAKIERVCVLAEFWNVLKILYVSIMICMCAYASYNNIYGFLYHRILSFTLTANVIWVVFDAYYGVPKKIMGIIRERRR